MPLALDVALKLLLEDEIIVHTIVPSLINPIPLDDIVKLLNGNANIIVAEEGNAVGGWSGELSSQLYFKLLSTLSVPIQRIGAHPWPIPCSKNQEESILPQEKDLIDAARAIVRR